MTYNGTLFIISAASGAGKTSLVQAVINKFNNIVLSVSYTTRNKRPKEQDGKDYFFVNKETFLQMQANGEFLEYAEVFDNYYATSKKTIMGLLVQGKDIILEIDWQGAKQIRNKINLFAKSNKREFNLVKIVNVFIFPPSLQVLQNRLIDRGQDDPIVIKQRLNSAKEEMRHYKEYDYLIINDNFNQAVKDLSAIIHATRLNIVNQNIKYVDLINNLLA